MSKLNMTYGDLREAMLRSEMQARVTLVLKIWISQLLRVVLDNALHE